MKERFTKTYHDDCTEEGHLFTFFCDICGRLYRSPLIRRTGAAKKTSKRKQRRLALSEAIHEAQLHFNRCPRCRRWVCDDDYDMDAGKCRHCTDKG